jgi:NADH-quinone oxidoreductase subunit G
MPKLTIDEREVDVPKGTTVIQAAEQLGIFIPRYCYHPGLSIAGNCRICLVEVEKIPKLQVACNTPVAEGMVVHTNSAGAEDGRRSVLEFLLANHPLDCPVCDQAGECDLQNFYMNFGLYNPRFREDKVKKHKAVTLGPHVMLDQERCILCSRCVRFTDEITKTGEFGIFNRGDRAELGIYPGDTLDNPYSANVVDICPVGALTERKSRFKTRVWYLSSAPTICNGCSRGCNMDLHYVLDRPHLNDGARVVRVKPRYNADVNEWWLCDEGRYGFGWADEERLGHVRGPALAANGALQNGASTLPADDWKVALAAIASSLSELQQAGHGERIAVIASAQQTNEELFLTRELVQRGLGARVTTLVPDTPGAADEFLMRADKYPNTRAAQLLGLAGTEAPFAASLVTAGLNGEIDALWVSGHDLVAHFGADEVRRLADELKLFVYVGPNDNPTAALAHWVLPTAAYFEADGTFVNCDGRVQRIGRAFAAPAEARAEQRVLIELAELLELSLPTGGPAEIFLALAAAEAGFAGMTYASLGQHGQALAGGVATTGAGAP